MSDARPIPNNNGYGQLCAVGAALDAVGDRWTLLVLRDLARASLRFSDLQAINPGMSPNLLTTRLRKLEDAGLVERHRLPHPGSGQTYSLTEDTRAVVLPVLTTTAALGAFLVDRMPIEDLEAMDLPTVLASQMRLNGHFVAARMQGIAGYFVLDMSGIETHLLLGPDGFDVLGDSAPESPSEPRAVLHFFPPTTLMRLMGNVMTVDDAEKAGLFAIEGDRAAALELLRLLSFSD